jgi:hypothetical protein
VIAGLLMQGLGAAATAQQQVLMAGHDAVAAPGLAWSEAKSIPPGAQMIMIYGSPGKPGPYIFRVKFPAAYKLPPHRHEDARSVTVLTGNYWSAAGEAFDPSKLRKFGPKDYYTTDAGVPHYAWAETAVIIQEMGMGPVSNPIEYVNPADDPRR